MAQHSSAVPAHGGFKKPGYRAHDSDYGTDELSSDTLSRMPRSVMHAARRGGALKGRRQRGGRRDAPYGSCGSSSEQGGSDGLGAAPWLMISGIPCDPATATLGEEVMCFGQFMSLTAEEKASRNMLRSSLQKIAQCVWPACTVKVYGSFAYGLSLHNSDVDMVVEDCAEGIPGHFAYFVSCCTENGFEVLGSIESSASDAFLKAKNTKSGLVGNVTFTAGKSPVRSSVSVIKQQLQRYPAAGPVVLAIRTVLSQCNLNDVPSGGLSSFAVTLMTFHLCERMGGGFIDAGDLLKEFLRYYGLEFDFNLQSVSWNEVERAKVHPECMCSVLDPLDGENNVADTCVKVPQIRAMLKYCHMALAKWDSTPADSSTFRGRTPLSTIIAHKALWHRLAKVQVPPSTPSSPSQTLSAPSTPAGAPYSPYSF